MPRKDRRDVVCDDSMHHVVQRGVNRAKVFNEPKDFEKFRTLMKRYLPQYEIALYNYCLMPNHIHLLLHVKARMQLSQFMHSLSLAYSAHYRYAYKYTGYLWQGRYKNMLIEKDSYLLECARYIERNPLRANIVQDLSKYPWSSYSFYAKSKKDSLITPNPLCEVFGKTPGQKRQHYIEYILNERPYERMLDDVLQL